jgi:hypothetical protein
MIICRHACTRRSVTRNGSFVVILQIPVKVITPIGRSKVKRTRALVFNRQNVTRQFLIAIEAEITRNPSISGAKLIWFAPNDNVPVCLSRLRRGGPNAEAVVRASRERASIPFVGLV